MKQMIGKILQKALNRYLALDPESSDRLRSLNGKIVTLELLGVGVPFQLVFLADGIQLNYADFLKADTEIKGTPFTLLRMMLTSGDRKHFFSDDVSITGNLELGQQVIDLFDQLEIDWEEYLSRWVGDVSAHQVGRFARSINKFNRRVRETFLQNINEYVHEEAELFPVYEELQDFFSDVDMVRMDVDRMEMRVQKLKADI